MFILVLILMIGIPALEIWGLVTASQIIGGFQTVLAVIATGLIGAYLAKREGLKAWIQSQEDLMNGNIPTKAILDGISIFAGGLLLLTPGFFTDSIGLFLILPLTRTPIQAIIIKWIDKKIKNGEFNFYYRKY